MVCKKFVSSVPRSLFLLFSFRFGMKKQSLCTCVVNVGVAALC